MARAVVGTAQAIAALDPDELPGRYIAASLHEASTPDLGLRYRRLPWPRRLVQAAWMVMQRPVVDRALGRPGLVHLMHAWAPVPTRAPLVVTVHDLFPLTHPQWLPGLPGRLHRAGLRVAAERARMIVANSSATAAAVHAGLGVEQGRIAVVPWGVDERFRQPAPATDIEQACTAHGLVPGDYVVTVGEVNDRKNGRVLLEALARLPPEMALVVVGAGGHGAERFWTAAHDLDLASRVRRLGWVDDAELRAVLAGAAVLAHPSLDEGFGFTPLEAMAGGVPVVVSASGALPETVGDGALVIAPHDADAWAEAIDRLGSDREHRAELVRRARQRASTFTWRRTAEELVSIHRRVLD